MKTTKFSSIACLIAAASLAMLPAHAAKPPAEPAAPSALNDTGRNLAKEYAAMLDSLVKEIEQALPKTDESLKTSFLKACEAEMAAAEAVKKAHAAASSKKATDKEAAQKALADAQQVLADAQAKAQKAADGLLASLGTFLADGKLDTRLAKAMVLAHATPDGLASFAQSGKEHQALINNLFADDALLQQMLAAGGAAKGKYGEALQIYSAIRKASPKASEGHFQRLALATALEHADPIAQNNLKDQTSSAVIIDPLKRYAHYEKACLDGELDPAFPNLSVWEMRMVVNGDAPDEIQTWGREMLRNYRPDHLHTENPGWRYSLLIKTDVLYGSKDAANDLPSLQQYQNILKHGGVCGRRAFFARFLLRSFGIPVWGVTQKGHAAVGRWTPGGWVVNLGAAFKWSWWDKDDAPRSGSDFLLETQARRAPAEFPKVLRARTISKLLGESSFNDRQGTVGGFWSNIAQYQTRAIAAAIDAKDLGTVGEDVAESNESKEVEKVATARATEADKKVHVSGNGVITIPAVAVATTSADSGFIVMASHGGGMQLHCARDMKSEQFIEYSFEAPKAGKYQLAARVVTVQSDQKFQVSSNGSIPPADFPLPYTLGKWESTSPVEVMLKQGHNSLRLTRPVGSRGVSIKEFTLTPVP